VVEAAALALGEEVQVEDAGERDHHEEAVDAGSNVALHGDVVVVRADAVLVAVDAAVAHLRQDADDHLRSPKG